MLGGCGGFGGGLDALSGLLQFQILALLVMDFWRFLKLPHPTLSLFGGRGSLLCKSPVLSGLFQFRILALVVMDFWRFMVCSLTPPSPFRKRRGSLLCKSPVRANGCSIQKPACLASNPRPLGRGLCFRRRRLGGSRGRRGGRLVLCGRSLVGRGLWRGGRGRGRGFLRL